MTGDVAANAIKRDNAASSGVAGRPPITAWNAGVAPYRIRIFLD